MLGQYGRLGNQMFQVAATACLAKDKNCDLVLPNTDLAVIRKYFDIPCIDLNKNHFALMKGRWSEPHFSYSPEIKNLPVNLDILGYLQSQKYITDDIFIKSIFKFKENTLNKARDLLPKGELISVHVRRGDYLNFPNVFPLPSQKYYNLAIELIKKERPESIPVIFTNDENWCRNNFGNMPIFSNEEHMDLCMMTLCDHHVIANSSFSWWGAWLAKSEKQIVFAPKDWFGKEGPQDFQDLFPSNFRKL